MRLIIYLKDNDTLKYIVNYLKSHKYNYETDNNKRIWFYDIHTVVFMNGTLNICTLVKEKGRKTFKDYDIPAEDFDYYEIEKDEE